MVIDTGTVTDSKFVGRERELEELTKDLEEANAGHGRLVVVEGEAGIGKTRLIMEVQRIAVEQGFETLMGRCLSLQQTDPYSPFLEALGDRLRIKISDEDTEIAELPLGLRSMGEGENGAIGEPSSLPMGLLPMAESGDADISKIDIQSERDKLFNNVLDVIINTSKEKPLLLFIDDLQWADTATLQMLSYITRNITNSKVLLCTAYRLEEVKLADGETPFAQIQQQVDRSISHKRIVLEMMPDTDISEIIQNIVGVKEVPERFLRKIYDESEGNPFFVEEVVKSLMDEGIILRHGHIWDTGVDISSIRIPKTISDVITHRIARLDEDAKRILRFASVIGDRYSFEVLKEVTEISDNLLLDSLDKLMEADIILEVSGSKEEEFVFAHKLTRSVVYGSMSKSRVRVLHLSVGDIIERLYSDNLEAWIFELARHFTMGKSFPNAYKYSIIAGDKAFRTLAFEEAVEYYISAHRTIDFLPEAENLDKDSEKLRLSMIIGNIYISLANFPTAKQYYDIALKLSRKKEDEKAEEKALIAVGHSLRLAGDFRKAEESYGNAAKISDKLGDLESMAEVQRGLGYVHWRKGENDDAVEHYNQSISLSMKAGDLSSMAKTFIELGNVYNHWGDQNKAIEYYNKSLDELEKLDDYSELARAHNNLGDSYMKLKNWDKAIEHLDKSGVAAEKIGNKQFIAWALFNSAEALANMGELDKALKYCESALDICETTDDKIGMQGIFKNYGLIYRLMKEWDKSIENFNKAIVILEMLDIAYELGIAYFELAKTYEVMGENLEAVNNLMMAKDFFENVGAKPEAKEAEEKVKALEAQ